jgi:peptidoglycan hydrolase-like protein with peptidoglycan-binding domain
MKNLLVAILSIGTVSSFANVDTQPSPSLYEGAIETPRSTPINKTDYVKTTVDMVRKSQSSLQERGYNTGASDGVIGSRTKSAIMDFQKENSLPQTGNLNRETLERLNIDSDYSKKTYESDQYSE